MVDRLSTMIYIYIYGTWAAGMVMVPCGSGWGACGWVGMLVDGVVVFANGVESCGICKEFNSIKCGNKRKRGGK